MPKKFYSSFLEQELKARQSKNSRYSLRAFAEFLDLHPSALSRILAGKQELSVTSALQVIRKLKLAASDQERFIVSVAQTKYRQALADLREATDLKLYKGELKESEESYRALFDVLEQAVTINELVRDQNGRATDAVILRANKSWEMIYDRSVPQDSELRLSEIMNSNTKQWIEIFERVVNSRKLERVELYSHSLDKWFNALVRPTEGDRFVVVALDVTPTKKSEEHWRDVMNVAPDILWRTNPDGNTTWINQRWMDYTGMTLEQSQGWGWLEAIHPDDRAKSAKGYEGAVSGGQPFAQKHRIRSASGQYRWFVVRTAPMLDENGNITHIYGSAFDIEQMMELLKSI